MIRVEKKWGKQPLEGFLCSFLTNCGDSFDEKRAVSFDETYSKYTFVFEEIVRHWYHVCQTDVCAYSFSLFLSVCVCLFFFSFNLENWVFSVHHFDTDYYYY
jgi:hypothetical protein